MEKKKEDRKKQNTKFTLFQNTCNIKKNCILYKKNKHLVYNKHFDKMSEENSGLTKELKTFLSWGKEEIIGHEDITEHDKTISTKIWCKVYAKFKSQLLDDPVIIGGAKNSLKAFTEGTN